MNPDCSSLVDSSTVDVAEEVDDVVEEDVVSGVVVVDFLLFVEEDSEDSVELEVVLTDDLVVECLVVECLVEVEEEDDDDDDEVAEDLTTFDDDFAASSTAS